MPTLLAYDPAFAYEVAIIINDGIERMYKKGDNVFYYITVMNEPYAMPAMPEGAREGILKGMYRFRAASNPKAKLRAQLFGSGAILREAMQAQEILEEKFNVAADVWSVTSYKSLYYDGIEAERWNFLHPGEKPRVPYVTQWLENAPGVLVAASDYLKTLPNLVSKWMPRRWLPSEPTGSAAAKAAPPFGTSSKWTRVSSYLRPSTNCCAKARSSLRGRKGHRRPEHQYRKPGSPQGIKENIKETKEACQFVRLMAAFPPAAIWHSCALPPIILDALPRLGDSKCHSPLITCPCTVTGPAPYHLPLKNSFFLCESGVSRFTTNVLPG